MKRSLEHYMRNREFQKTSQTEFMAEKFINEKGDKTVR